MGNEKRKTRKMSKRDLFFLAVGVFIVIIVLNFLSSRHFVRMDLTEAGDFTLSDSTKNVLENLEDVVNIRLYFSRELPPALFTLKRDLDDTLAEYSTFAGNKLNVEYIDPQETPKQEQQVRLMGIPPIQVNVIQKDKQELVKLYLGIVVVHGDKKEVIPVVQNVANLEYDLTSAILKVTTDVTPKIKWLGSSGKDQYTIIKEWLKRRYEIENVSNEFKLDPAEDTLLIIATEDQISEKDLFEIDQYLMSGGKIFVMTDMVKIGGNLTTSLLDSNVPAWLGHYGIEIKDKLLLDRSNTHAAFSGGYITYHIAYPFWVKIVKKGFDQDNPIVSDLEALVLPWVSPMEVISEKDGDVQISKLVKSTIFNSLASLDTSLMPEDAEKLIAQKPTSPKTLSVLMSGKIKSSFGDGKMPLPEGVKEFVSEASNAQLLAISNSRFINDKFLKQFNNNHLFFENAVDYLAMGSELIGIRSKGVVDRPLPELSSAGLAVIKYLNILGGSVVLLFVGFLVFLARRKRNNRLKSQSRNS